MSYPIGVGRPPTRDEEPETIPLSAEQATNRASYVRTMITKIERYQKEKKTLEEIENMPHIGTFKKDYPKLYETLVSTEPYHKQSLHVMLQMLDQMGTGRMSQNDASVIVGQRVFDTFVKPQVQSNQNSTH